MAQQQTEWIFQGACKDYAPDDFFPERASPDRSTQVAWVKQVCFHQCPVRQQCLRDALERDDRHGMWGGLTYRERRNLLRRQGRRHLHAA